MLVSDISTGFMTLYLQYATEAETEQLSWLEKNACDLDLENAEM